MSDASLAETIAQVPLTFSDWRPRRHVEDPLHKDLSAVTRVGDCLFLACDETASVERLRRMDDGRFGDHQHFALDDLVDLPAGADGEMDIEGLCADEAFSGLLARTRSSAASPNGMRTAAPRRLRTMEAIEREPNRYFLGGSLSSRRRSGLFTARSDGRATGKLAQVRQEAERP